MSASTIEPAAVQNTSKETYFNWKEAPDGWRADNSEPIKSLYRRLWGHDMGPWSLKYHDEAQLRRMEKAALFDAVAAQLDVPLSVERYGRKIINQLDLRRYKRNNEKWFAPVLASFCLCAVLCHKRGWPTHPNHADLHDRFAYVMESLDITEDEFKKYFGRMHYDLRTLRGQDG